MLSLANAAEFRRAQDILARIDRSFASNEVADALEAMTELRGLAERLPYSDIEREYEWRRATAHYRTGGYATAISICEDILEQDPAHTGACLVRALSMKDLGRVAEAATELARLLEREPASTRCRLELADAYCSAGDEGRCEQTLREGLSEAVDRPFIEACLGTSLLRQKRWAEGWRHYERRLDAAPLIPATASECPKTGLPVVCWTDGDQPGHLSVWAEKGVGDAVVFAGLVLRLRLGGPPVRFYVEPHLQPYLADLHPAVDVASNDDCRPARTDEHWIALLSLPSRLALDLDEFQQTTPVLKPVEEPRTAIEQPLRVGLIWQANPRFPSRSIRLADLEDLVGPDFQLVSLQHGAGVDQLDEIPFSGLIHSPSGTALAGQAFTAALPLLESVDVVVGVDTTLTHFAAAAGKPVLLLLQKHSADWRWPTDRAWAPWFPATRCIRQRTQGSWAGCVADCIETLDGWAKGSPERASESQH